MVHACKHFPGPGDVGVVSPGTQRREGQIKKNVFYVLLYRMRKQKGHYSRTAPAPCFELTGEGSLWRHLLFRLEKQQGLEAFPRHSFCNNRPSGLCIFF
jgi:hypothetical protein